MINGTEPLMGPMRLTANQLIQLVNATCGGWPVKADSIYMFESNDPKETIYRFVDERGYALYSPSRRLYGQILWEKRITRDDYLVYHLSRDAKKKFQDEARTTLKQKLASLL